MHGIRESHLLWTVARIERDENGLDDGYVECASFWHQSHAIAERDRLEAANKDESFYCVIDESTATVVYPSDELPPWIEDPGRLKRRGYETT